MSFCRRFSTLFMHAPFEAGGVCYSSGFMLVYTVCTSSNSSIFSTILLMVSRCSGVTSFRSLGMYVNSPPTSSKPLASRAFCISL